MKTIILAGGLGTRISEETAEKPKPMVLINEKPILWHIMNIFSSQGYNDFILALGYKNEVILDWLESLFKVNGIRNVDKHGKTYWDFTNPKISTWRVIGLDTGLLTQTGGRIAQCMELCDGEKVFVTYGDGLANVDISGLKLFHEAHKKLATVTAVRPPARFGYLKINDQDVLAFGEKNQADAGWINGGFFVLEPGVRDYVLKDEAFESGALPRLVTDNNLKAFKHEGFWKPMDTLREKNELNTLSHQPIPPWLKF